MHKLLTSFLLVFIGMSLLAGVIQGGGGIVSTTLTDDLGINATFIPAASTESFANADIIRIDTEKILYSSKNATGFNVYYRGYDGTDAAIHMDGARIYTQEAGVLNSALGFDVGVQVETSGTYGIIMLPIRFFTDTVPHMVKLNASFLTSPELAFIGIFWFGAGIALLVTLAIAVAPIAISAISGLLGLLRR